MLRLESLIPNRIEAQVQKIK